MGKCPGSFLVRKEAFEVMYQQTYPLVNSAILDSGTTIHIFNRINRFKKPPRLANPGDFVWAGEHPVPIEGYGEVDIKVQGPNGPRIITLTDVAFCPTFACNLVSLRHLLKRGIWWDTSPSNNCLRRYNHSILCHLRDEYDQFVLEYLPSNMDHAAMTVYRKKINSWTARAASRADAMTWHLRLGHPGPQVLEHFVNASQGAKIKGITTVECDSCGQGKAHRLPHRQPRPVWEWKLGERLALDTYDFKLGRGKFSTLLVITDRTTGYAWDYYLQNHLAESILSALRYLFAFLKRQYNATPKILESDNEITSANVIKTFLSNQGIKSEPSAPDTQAQNGGAERAWRTIKEKIRTMGISANLPDQLWPEIARAATYLYNRTPKQMHNWESPYERFYQFVAQQDNLVVEHRKPNQSHLKVYGYKAFAMTPEALRDTHRLERLRPKAWIGYLVGYNSSNIYRIWNPATNQVVSIRDVVFDETQVYPGTFEKVKEDVAQVDLEELARWLIAIEKEEQDQFELGSDEEDSEETTTCTRPCNTYVDQDIVDLPVDDEVLDTIVVKGDVYGDLPEVTYPTPPPTPPTAFLTALFAKCQSTADQSYPTIQPWEAAFAAGPAATIKGTVNKTPITKAAIERLRRQPHAITHQSDLPPLPRWHSDLKDHPLGEQFRQAEKDHLESHAKMAS